MSNRTMICTRCRDVQRSNHVCAHCRADLVEMPWRWRAPAKRDDAAWRSIGRGDIWWDRRRLAKVAQVTRWALVKGQWRRTR